MTYPGEAMERAERQAAHRRTQRGGWLWGAAAIGIGAWLATGCAGMTTYTPEKHLHEGRCEKRLGSNLCRGPVRLYRAPDQMPASDRHPEGVR